MRRSLLQLALAGIAALLLWSTSTTAQVLGVPEQNERFGHAVATGDFNGDGYADLSVGAPRDQVAGNNAGAVHVIFGSGAGLAVPGNLLLQQGVDGILDASESGDRFGETLAAGDFNGDGYDDLAVGIPGESFLSIDYAGAVLVIYGSDVGPQTSLQQFWSQPDWGDNNEGSDRLGQALTAGDFDGDGFVDLAIGVPQEDDGATQDVGIVHILYGTAAGLDVARHQPWWQDDTGIDTNEPFDWFGAALSAGDFDGDGFDDLAIGVLMESFGATDQGGVVNVLYGSGSGLSSTGSQLWRQGASGLPGVAEDSDRFGTSLASGDFNGDGFDDLVVGAPNEDIGPIENTGNVTHLYGTASGLSATGSGSFSSPPVGLPLEEDRYFGRSLASKDLNGDAFDDLIVGAPGLDNSGVATAGAIAAIPGVASGLDVAESVAFTQADPDVFGTPEIGDQWGFAVAAGDFDGDGSAEIAVGAPKDDDPGVGDAGIVNALYGVFSGLDFSQLWYQGANPVANEPTAPLPTLDGALRVYPNPSWGVLHIEVPSPSGAEVTVTDILGRAILRTRTVSGRAEVDVSSLAPGVYVVRLEAEGATVAQTVTLLR